MGLETIDIQPQFSGKSTLLDPAQPNHAYELDTATNKILAMGSGKHLLLQFPTRKIPHDFVVSNARIGLFMRDANTVNVSVYRATTLWDRSATWNQASSTLGSPWINPGGDFETSLSFTASFGGAVGWSYIGFSHPNLLLMVNDWLDEYRFNYGFLLQITAGSATAYSMDDIGASYTEQNDTTDSVQARTTKYHPKLTLYGCPNKSINAGALSSSIYTVQDRLTRYTLTRPTTNLPVTLGDGIPYLDRQTACGDLTQEWSFRRARRQVATTIEMTVDRDQSDDPEHLSASTDFWYPCEVVEFEERFSTPTQLLRSTRVAIGVIDSAEETVRDDITSTHLTLRDPAQYGLISTFEGTLQNKKRSIPPDFDVERDGVVLTQIDSHKGYWIYVYYDPVTLEPAYNWCSDPGPDIFTGTGTHQHHFKESETLKVFHGLGQVWIEQKFFRTDRSQGGMGDPSEVRAKIVRYSNVFDPPVSGDPTSFGYYFDAMPLNYAMERILRDAGYHRIENSGFLYLQSLPPVMADFVFDQVWKGSGGVVATNYSNAVQNESGAPLTSAVALNPGDELFFRMDRENHRFNRIYFVPYQPADQTAVFSWWIFLHDTPSPIWQQVTPADGSSPQAWVKGRTDPGSENLQNEGVIYIPEELLNNWKASVLAGTDGNLGFWMKVKYESGLNPARIHRFAGKQVMLLGQDKSANSWSHFDERQHFELVQELIDRWGVPNYYVGVDPYGDVVGEYIVQKATADYQLTPLDQVQRVRDSTKVFTEVRVRVPSSLNTQSANWASLLMQAQATAPLFTWVDENDRTWDSTDFFRSNIDKNTTTPQDQIDRALENSGHSYWGIEYKAASNTSPPRGKLDVTQLDGAILIQVDFQSNGGAVAIELLAYNVYLSSPSWVIAEGFVPDDPINNPGGSGHWIILPDGDKHRDWDQTPQFGKSPSNVVDLTLQPSLNHPVISKVRLRIKEVYYRGKIDHATEWHLWINSMTFIGVAVGSAIEGIAVLGTTPPFNTANDIALFKRFGRRVFAVQNNPFITSIPEANRAALNILRELYRLVDPLEVSGIYPLIRIGETVQVQNSFLGSDTTYVVESVEGKPYSEYSATLVPYRFSSFTTPPAIIPPSRTEFLILPGANCATVAAGGGSTPTEANLIFWYHADSDNIQIAPESMDTTFWGDDSGNENDLDDPTSTLGGLGPVLTGNLENGYAGEVFAPSRQIARHKAYSGTPHHFFIVLKTLDADWHHDAFIFQGFGLTSLRLADTGTAEVTQDTTHFLEIPVPTDATYILDFYLHDMDSFIALNRGTQALGQTGMDQPPGEIGCVIGAPVDATSYTIFDFRGYDGKLSDTDRRAVYDELAEKYNITLAPPPSSTLSLPISLL